MSLQGATSELVSVSAPAASTGRARRQRGARAAYRLSGTLAHVVLIVLAVFALLPIVVMVATSFKQKDKVFQIPPRLFPEHATLENYVRVFADSNMPRALLNSVLVALLVAAVTLLLGLTTGYAIARIPFRGSGGLAVGLLLGQLLPVTVLLLPLFQVVSRAHLVDTIPGIALTHLTIVLPLVTWMATSTFRAVPLDIEEAALIDGCGRWRAVWSVVLPVAAPGIIALAVFSVLQSWNEFVFASVVARSLASKTAPVALTDFAGQFSVDWGATTAASTVMAVPITIAFLFVQKYFVQGMAAGAVKG
jgi:ABC-type glycerol-3-phosphate transport system permease component